MAGSSIKVNGFTLIELITVIVIIGIISLAIIPKISITTFKESSDADIFLSNIRFAQHESMITGHNWRVKIISSKKYIVDNDSNDSNGLPHLPGGDNPVSVETSISGSPLNEIYFDYLGRPVDENGKLITKKTIITINKKRVIIEPFSGGVYIE